MTLAAFDVQRLERERPEWKPWLALVEETLREAAARAWDSAVPREVRSSRADLPLLAGATITLEAGSARRVLRQLVRVAARRGTSKLASLASLLDREVDALTLFAASLSHAGDGVEAADAGRDVDPEALQGVVALLAVPFLQACHRRWARVLDTAWVKGYCPVCGSWPALAEVRGIERSRFLRCGRCGAAWHANALSCPFCATSDHNELAALVPAGEGTHAIVEACTRCSGYVKTFTTLQGCAAGAVMLHDLASVDLDLAAMEHGYARPGGTAHPLAVTIAERAPARRFLAWKT